VDTVLEKRETEVVGTSSWFQELRSEALAEYGNLSWPSRKDEDWRFGSPAEAVLSSEEIAEGGASLEVLPGLEGALRFIFENNRLVRTEGEVPVGLLALPLLEALEKHGNFLKSVLPPLQGKLGSRKLAAFHRARCADGVVVYAEPGVQVETPVEIVHVVSGEATVLPFVLIATGDGASLRVIERFVSANATDATSVVAVSDVIAGENSSLRYLVTQDLNAESKFIRLTDSRVEKGAVSKVASVHVGARWAREETYSTVEGEESKSEILSITVPATGQQYDQRTFQNHAVGHTMSDLLYKNTLFGKAKTVFSGLIFVGEAAHHTDAYQTCRNLLMSDDAEATSMPGLEINADQVKCSHGSTSSQVNEDEIFYLCARGIAPETARNLVARGFSVEVADRLEDAPLEEAMLALVDAKFARLRD